MSLFFSRAANLTAAQMIAERTGSRLASGSSAPVSRKAAMQQSAVWACLVLRADLLSTMPIDVFRRVGGVQVEQTKPAVLLKPGGSDGPRWTEFAFSSQLDLDSVGNHVSIIRAFDGLGLPALLEPVDIDDVVVRRVKGKITYRIGGTTYDRSEIWHERQYTTSGSPVGLSPIAFAAMTLNAGASAARFAADWFGNNAVPASHLKNTAKTISPLKANLIKQRVKASMTAGEPFVSGQDWEWNMIAAKASEAQFLEQGEATSSDICRYLGVPGDMVDVPVKGSAITYANITQRNLQFLITKLGPAIARREDAVSNDLLPQPRYLKLNTNALLRMDLKSRYDAYKVGVDGRWLPPSRILEKENEAPLTPEEEAEFARLFPSKSSNDPASPAREQLEQGVSA